MQEDFITEIGKEFNEWLKRQNLDGTLSLADEIAAIGAAFAEVRRGQAACHGASCRIL